MCPYFRIHVITSLQLNFIYLFHYDTHIPSTHIDQKNQYDAKLRLEICDLSLYSLLLGRKVMTNLDSILKRRDITLPTKVHLVKAMVFPVVMYGCESWTVKAEH